MCPVWISYECWSNFYLVYDELALFAVFWKSSDMPGGFFAVRSTVVQGWAHLTLLLIYNDSWWDIFDCCWHLSSCISYCSFHSMILFESVVMVLIILGAYLMGVFTIVDDLPLKWPFFPLVETRLRWIVSNWKYWTDLKRIQLLSIGNEMMWAMDEVPLQFTLILASKRDLWFKVCSSISTRRTICLSIVPKVSAVQQSNGSPLMEIKRPLISFDTCVSKLYLLIRGFDLLKQLWFSHLVLGKRKGLFNRWRNKWRRNSFLIMGNDLQFW